MENRGLEKQWFACKEGVLTCKEFLQGVLQSIAAFELVCLFRREKM